MRHRDSCFCLIDSARLEFDKLVESCTKHGRTENGAGSAERPSPFRV